MREREGRREREGGKERERGREGEREREGRGGGEMTLKCADSEKLDNFGTAVAGCLNLNFT